jgi:hypothetical protein
MVVVEHNSTTLNHNIVYLNTSFIDVIGWSLEEIPTKDHWWKKAYPDPQYQKVVESLWEMEMESVDLDKDSLVTITVNIMTKHKNIKRFQVNTELKSSLKNGYYIVSFEEVKTLK